MKIQLLVLLLSIIVPAAGLAQDSADQAKLDLTLLERCGDEEHSAVGDLLEAGANPNLQDEDGNPILYLCTKKADNRAVSDLLKYGADPGVPSIEGELPLAGAVISGEFDLVEELLAYGADPLQKVDGRGAPIMLLAQYGTPAVCSLMLDACNPEMFSGWYRAHLFSEACCYSNLELGLLLICGGLEVNEELWSGKTPLHEACRYNNYEMVELLLRFGADPNLCDDNGDTPLHVLSDAGAFCFQDYHTGYKIGVALLNAGCDINALDNDKQTPLDAASPVSSICGTGINFSLLRLLEEQGAVHGPDWTPPPPPLFLDYLQDGQELSPDLDVYSSIFEDSKAP